VAVDPTVVREQVTVHEFLDGKLAGEAAVADLPDLDLFNRWFLLATAAFKSK